jgi:hypothetical protein
MRRRDLLKGAAGLGLSAAVGCAPLSVRDENRRRGTADWMLTKSRLEPLFRARSPWIEGYCSRTTLRAGEELSIYVSTNPAAPFRLDLYRMGYYDATGGRHVGSWGPMAGTPQREPSVGEERLRECRWEPSLQLRIPNDWPSGVYLGKLTEEKENLQSYVIFVVRDDRPCDLIYQCSDATWSAYNRWPDWWSMYQNGKKGSSWSPEVQVSWDRPYGLGGSRRANPLSLGCGEFMQWEFPFVYWLEREGYDVSYVGTLDTHRNGAGLNRARGFLSVGHDEYWSIEMYRNVKAAIDGGVSVGFFGANMCFGMVPFLPSTSGTPDRVITRKGKFGPLDPAILKDHPEYGLFRESGPSEATIVGASCKYAHMNVGADWICSTPNSWVYDGTGMKQGDAIPGLIGYETEGDPIDLPGLEVVARGSVKNDHGVEGTYAATVYPGPLGNWVFNAASIWYSDGLSAPPGYRSPSGFGARPQGADPRVQRITSNVLGRFLGGH